MFERLLDILFPPRVRELSVRSTSKEEVLARLSPRPLPHEGAALLPYKDPLVKALITEAKFCGNERAQALLGEVLSDYLHDALPDVLSFEEREVFLLPIPLSKKRYRERGYNQVEEIARRAGGVPMKTHVVRRVRDTTPQTTLGKEERKKNVVGAFEAREVNSKHLYIVLDDVATTGATLEEAVRALRDAGATRVIPIALAY